MRALTRFCHTKQECTSYLLISLVAASRGLGTTFKTMEYEPEGVVTSYLNAGAPCVVGNLWDVSDRDIDRFTIELLEKLLGGGDGENVAQCVADSRGVCKMKYIVGGAVVVYGVPIYAAKK